MASIIHHSRWKPSCANVNFTRMSLFSFIRGIIISIGGNRVQHQWSMRGDLGCGAETAIKSGCAMMLESRDRKRALATDLINRSLDSPLLAEIQHLSSSY